MVAMVAMDMDMEAMVIVDMDIEVILMLVYMLDHMVMAMATDVATVLMVDIRNR